ncbi:MAG: GDP-mannose 4,6-dehydratase, partial [Candidatus Heimdallarchaeaceae archaeon]
EAFFEQLYEKHKNLLIDPDNLEKYLSNFDKEKKDLFDIGKFEGCRILITGISGFVGSHLAEKLVSSGKNLEIHGIIRRQSVPFVPNIKNIIDKIKIQEANLIDYSSIETAIEKIEPHYIFHLAAQSFVPTSFKAPLESVETNIGGTVNILEVLRKKDIDLLGMQVACSSEEYGLVYPDEVPITENNPLRPQSPYGVSKVATEFYSLTYYRAYGLPIKITRGFNHTGPKRGLQFVTSVIASQIARSIKTNYKIIKIGNPKPIRDFTDIKDMIQGYLLAILKGKNGEVYNLGHGFGISIENLVKLTANLYDIKYKLQVDKTKFRPAEVNVLLCDYSKANRELGFKPQYPLTETMKSIVEFYLSNNIYMKLV